MHRLSLFLLMTLLISGCAQTTLKAPCPDYGKYCHKIPINHWNNENL